MYSESQTFTFRRKIHVGLHRNVTGVGIEALASLPNLTQLTFNQYPFNKELEQCCLPLTAKYLPKLKVVGRRFYVKVPMGYHNYLRNIDEEITLGLVKLALSEDVHPSATIHLPDLKLLCLLRPSGDLVGLCSRFKTITELDLCDIVEANEIMLLLKSVGLRLNKLTLSPFYVQLSLREILIMCPNLKSLGLSGLYYFLDMSATWPADSFLRLEEVYLGREFPPGFLVQVLIQTIFFLIIDKLDNYLIK